MMKCADCGADTHTFYSEYNVALCSDCFWKRKQKEIEKESLEVHKASDFSKWRHEDMSELFWMHLGKYIREPNDRSIQLMYRAYRWACHDNAGLANSFRNALKWAKIDLYVEQEKWMRKQRMEKE